ncbi:Ger(x)C family spore germination protein [Effusibacillus lacus]|uniref:Spore gernimation protein n=1 Tax=Effusibacillus lacus TaxID=1348429 RepID=A0A292YNG7_9BACL|nr:Ger(x)C family spore germination protein [Effusibacillus lacus]TCS68953.1 Ger(x)C family germination protein [Effusibacillus lacus]GAX91478.1 spore gernimation protein [Effusibacillus lacus]
MRRLLAIVLCSLLIVSSLTGCWDRRELEQRASVVAFAVDKNQEDPNLVDVAIQVPIPIRIVGAGGGGGGEGGKEAVRILTGSGRSVLAAFQNIERSLNQQLFYGHTRIVVVSSEVAKTDIEDFVDVLRRSPQVRRLLWPVVVPGRAAELLYKDPKLEQIPMMFIKEMLESGARDKRIPDVTLGDFFISMSDTSIQPMMHMVAPTQKGMKWIGMAVFRDGKMVGNLKEPHVWAYMNMGKEQPGGDVVIACFDSKDRDLTFHPRRVSSKVKVEEKNGEIRALYDVKMEGDIFESECNVDFNNEAVINKVQNAIEVELEKRAKEMIHHVQRDLASDVLGLGFAVRAFHPEIWKKVDWDKTFPKVKIDVSYHVKVRRFGMTMGKQE